MAKLPLIKTKKTKNQNQTKIINTLYIMTQERRQWRKC